MDGVEADRKVISVIHPLASTAVPPPRPITVPGSLRNPSFWNQKVQKVHGVKLNMGWSSCGRLSPELLPASAYYIFF